MRQILASTLLLFAFVIALPGHVESGSSVSVVVNSKVSAENISFDDLRRILLGDKQFWEGNNQRVTLLVRAAKAPERTVLLDKIYQMSEAQYKQYWIAKVFRAEATSGPKIVTSNKMACDLVKAIPGSIALVASADVPPGFKVLKVDGKKPGDGGYRLTY
ncbi:MAG: hypothetical protein AAB229_03935 [Candidatus Hydrogenedentota bacterium]|mgnify:CR=1 FL=1